MYLQCLLLSFRLNKRRSASMSFLEKAEHLHLSDSGWSVGHDPKSGTIFIHIKWNLLIWDHRISSSQRIQCSCPLSLKSQIYLYLEQCPLMRDCFHLVGSFIGGSVIHTCTYVTQCINLKFSLSLSLVFSILHQQWRL